MRISLAYSILIASSIQLLASTTNGQTIDKELVTIELQNDNLVAMVKKIEAQSTLRFIYLPEQLGKYGSVTLSKGKRTIRETLNLALAGTGMSYEESGKYIVLSERKETASVAHVMTYPVFNASLVKGKVTDQDGQGIAGVNIVIKGTTSGTTTDANGTYVVTAEDTDVLTFSFIGFKTIDIPVNARTSIDVSLEEDVSSLGQVTVRAGYYNVKERELPGNISRVSADEIGKQTTNNPLGSLIGRMPGVQITQNSGVPGGSFKVQIRGQNSLRAGGNDPLYIVDGVPFTPTSLTSSIGVSIIQDGNPLIAIDPMDIESVEVLKDADATAIYGSRGANGVVLITTKRGKSGKMKVDLKITSGVGRVPSKMSLLNTQQYVQMRKEAFANDARKPTLGNAYDLLAWDTTRYTDWQKELIGGTANTTNGQLSISGGTPNTQYLISGGFYRETTVFPGSSRLQRGSGSLNINHRSDNQKFMITIGVNYTAGTSNFQDIDLTRTALTLSPNAPALYDSTGDINEDWKNNFTQNPLFDLRRRYNSTTDNLITSAVISYKILKGLEIKSNLGYTNMEVKETRTSPISAIPPQFVAGQTGSSDFGNSSIKTWILEPQLAYTTAIGESKLTTLLGTSFQESIQQGQTLTATGYTSDASLENPLAATAVDITNASYTQYRYSAIFGRINYIWGDRYIINATGRRDGSSRFGPGKQFANFGAVGAAWIFTNENFLKDKGGVLSFGKLRASYGTTGSDAIGNYQYLNTFSSTTYPYNGTSGLYLTRLNNPDYSWESNKKMEIGLEIGILRDRLFITTSWYRNKSSNQLVGLPLPVLTGQPSVQANLPATVENKGLEFQITSTNISRDNFQWSTSLNLTVPKNKLLSFPNIEAFPTYNSSYEVGRSIFIQKTVRSLSVDPKTGLYTFQDVNNDNSITTADDGLFIKEISQKYFGGINNTFSYKGFQLTFFFQFVKQTGVNYLRSYTGPGTLSNQPDVVLNRWQESDQNSAIQKYSSTGATNTNYNRYKVSDASISDASFIRLKNVYLSWQLPAQWMQSAHLQNGKIYLQGQNLFTITNYLGLDPESRSSSSLPPLQVISLGAQITL